MIIVKFCGGLGNQMYQFAMLIALQKKYPKQEIKADISHYMLFEEHNGFELSSYFGIKLNYALYQEVKKVYYQIDHTCFYLGKCAILLYINFNGNIIQSVRNCIPM